MITCKVTIDQAALQQIYEKADRAIVMTAEDLQADVEKHDLMPYYSGESEKGTFVKPAGDRKAVIMTPAYYAKWNYFKDICWYTQEPFRKTHNKNAQGHWWDAYLDGKAYGFDIAKSFKKNMTILFGGGKNQ